ncbi:MAG: hypothetical protein KDB75_04585, partial [Flavobacteriales bacterium]|nr:hypothetical protein [Flavobacteriales bacterium]
MDLYSRKQRWKLVLAGVALLIVGASLWYSDRIVSKVREEERRKVELWAEAVRNRAELVLITEKLFDRLREEERKKVELYAGAQLGLVSGDPGDLGFYLKVVSYNTTVPVIITDAKGDVKFHRNLDPAIAGNDSLMRREQQAMAA